MTPQPENPTVRVFIWRATGFVVKATSNINPLTVEFVFVKPGQSLAEAEAESNIKSSFPYTALFKFAN